MLLLISDANILIDIEVGELTASMFSLGYQFAVPDILFEEELRGQHEHLLSLGLQTRVLSPDALYHMQQLAAVHRRPSRNDLFALALAAAEHCPLLTGDAALRKAAQQEGIEVKGSIWLLEQMLRQERISFAVARAALRKMRTKGRRLPWADAEMMLARFK